MDLTLLTTLKDKLLHTKDFTQIWEYFFDQFGEDPAFIALGERTRHPFLETVLEQVGRQLFGKPVTVAKLLLTRLPEQQFLHGGCTLNGKLANVIYFEDIHMGLLAVVLSVTPSDTKMVRFTGQPMPANWSPSQN
jgi:hypothetical protein